MGSNVRHPAIDEMVHRIVDQFHPESVILYGSHARGTAGPDSDVDLLVGMSIQGSRRKQATAIDLALADRELSLDLIVVTPEELERDRDRVGTIVRPATREGQVLYARPR
ncbi:MAG: nucleotidyltransferase domain-containing protein [Deltaproteobacteria bacterium]|nr:nucleotidyltransferase domain-containing protein [Deltaproteobacteria bacterium]